MKFIANSLAAVLLGVSCLCSVDAFVPSGITKNSFSTFGAEASTHVFKALPSGSDVDVIASSLSLSEDAPIDLSIEFNKALNEFVAWAQPQLEALAAYVAADLSKYWDQYTASLEARDSTTIIATGWGGLIFVLIVANTLARGGSEETRLAKFEAEQAAKEEEAAKAEAKAARGSLFNFSVGTSRSLAKQQEKSAVAAKRKSELEKKKFAARLEKKAAENKAAFAKKQKEKKKKAEQRRKVLTTDFQKRKGLGKFGKK